MRPTDHGAKPTNTQRKLHVTTLRAAKAAHEAKLNEWGRQAGERWAHKSAEYHELRSATAIFPELIAIHGMATRDFGAPSFTGAPFLAPDRS